MSIVSKIILIVIVILSLTVTEASLTTKQASAAPDLIGDCQTGETRDEFHPLPGPTGVVFVKIPVTCRWEHMTKDTDIEWEPASRIYSNCQNNGGNPIEPEVEGSTTVSTTWSLGGTLSLQLLEKLGVDLSAGKEWGDSKTFTETMKITIDPGMKGIMTAKIPIERTKGRLIADYRYPLGGRTNYVEDVEIRSPKNSHEFGKQVKECSEKLIGQN